MKPSQGKADQRVKDDWSVRELRMLRKQLADAIGAYRTNPTPERAATTARILRQIAAAKENRS
jgi:hypothetical protein